MFLLVFRVTILKRNLKTEGSNIGVQMGVNCHAW